MTIKDGDELVFECDSGIEDLPADARHYAHGDVHIGTRFKQRADGKDLRVYREVVDVLHEWLEDGLTMRRISRDVETRDVSVNQSDSDTWPAPPPDFDVASNEDAWLDALGNELGFGDVVTLIDADPVVTAAWFCTVSDLYADDDGISYASVDWSLKDARQFGVLPGDYEGLGGETQVPTRKLRLVSKAEKVTDAPLAGLLGDFAPDLRGEMDNVISSLEGDDSAYGKACKGVASLIKRLAGG